MKLSVIMPVYNESSNINNIIQKVLAVPVEKELIIVDDCSSDGTRKILEGIKDERVKLAFHEKTLGKGAGIRTGLNLAQGDIVVIQDADLEYDPQDYLPLLKKINEGKAKAVYGSRFLNGKYKSFQLWQFLANRILTGLTNLLFRVKLSDMETCYKMIDRKLIEELKLESNGFEIEPEITAKILKRKVEIAEVPISYRARDYREGKKIKAKDGFISLFTLIKYRFKS